MFTITYGRINLSKSGQLSIFRWFTLNSGTNLLISAVQLCSVDAGVTIRNGPHVSG